MPVTEAQWGWFLFYTGGAAWAWLYAAVTFYDIWRGRP